MKTVIPFLALAALAAQGQQLDQDYNLGRITGGRYTQGAVAADAEDGASLLMPVFAYRFGDADRWQFDLLHATFLLNNSDNFLFQTGLWGGQYTLRPVDGHHIRVSLATPNPSLWIGSNDSKIGFDDEFLPQIYRWELQHSMLSRGGQIELSSDEFNLAFLRRPLLDGGQYAHRILLKTDLGQDGDGFNNLYFTPRYGILPELEVRGQYNVDSYTLYNGMGSDSSYSMHLLALNAEYRRATYWITAGATLPRSEDFADVFSEFAQSNFLLSGGYLHGDRGLEFNQVQGNWDGFFTPLLGAQQLLFTGSLGWVKYDGAEYTNTNLNAGISYGVIDGLTAGVNQYLGGYEEWTDRINRTTLSATLSNIALRDYGPSDASALEYLWGYIPKAQEYRIDLSVILPNSKSNYYTSGTINPFQEIEVLYTDVNAITTKDQNRMLNGEISALALYGLSGSAFVHTEFSMSDEGDFGGQNATDLVAAYAGMGFHSEYWALQAGILYQKASYTNRYTDEAESVSEFGPFIMRLVGNF